MGPLNVQNKQGRGDETAVDSRIVDCGKEIQVVMGVEGKKLELTLNIAFFFFNPFPPPAVHLRLSSKIRDAIGATSIRADGLWREVTAAPVAAQRLAAGRECLPVSDYRLKLYGTGREGRGLRLG